MVPRKRPAWYANLALKDVATGAGVLLSLAGSVHGDRKAATVDERVTGTLALVQATAEDVGTSLDSIRVVRAEVKLLKARVRALERGKRLAEHPELYLVGPPVPPKPRPWWNPFRKEGQ